MATRFSHTARLDGTLETIRSSYADEAFWADRIRTVGTSRDSLDELVVGDDTIDVTLSQFVPDSDIPDMARKVLPGELSLVRSIHFSGFDGTRLLGTSRADAAGGIGVITGEVETTAEGDASVESLSGQVKVSVPLLAGKLEKLVVSHLSQLFEEEAAQLNNWISGR